MLNRRHDDPKPTRPTCSGLMTDKHTGQEPKTFRLAGQDLTLCRPCAEVAAGFGLIGPRELRTV